MTRLCTDHLHEREAIHFRKPDIDEQEPRRVRGEQLQRFLGARRRLHVVALRLHDDRQQLQIQRRVIDDERCRLLHEAARTGNTVASSAMTRELVSWPFATTALADFLSVARSSAVRSLLVHTITGILRPAGSACSLSRNSNPVMFGMIRSRTIAEG